MMMHDWFDDVNDFSLQTEELEKQANVDETSLFPTLGLRTMSINIHVCSSSRMCLQVWVKPSAEMSFLYGNHIGKSGLGRITENTPSYTGVVVYSMSDVPLGFGVTAKSTSECRTAEPNAIVVFHQADVGEYLRAEDDM